MTTLDVGKPLAVRASRSCLFSGRITQFANMAPTPKDVGSNGSTNAILLGPPGSGKGTQVCTFVCCLSFF